jgi:hypothetical protein
MAVRGEYWIQEDGSTWFADGDIGMLDHETCVLDTARRRMLDLFGLDSDNEIVDDEEFTRLLNGLVRDEVDETWPESPGAAERARLPSLLRQNIVENDADEKAVTSFDLLWPAANNQTDLRAFAIRQWGWAWVRGNNCAVQTLDPDTRKRLERGLISILDGEGMTGEEADSEEMHVSVQSNGKTFGLAVGQIACASLVDQLEQPNHDAAIKVARAQVKQMDEALEHPYYRNRARSGPSF